MTVRVAIGRVGFITLNLICRIMTHYVQTVPSG